jgi:hypothetical protein
MYFKLLKLRFNFSILFHFVYIYKLLILKLMFMKKITLLILLLFIQVINAQYLTEDFEGGTTIPPAGWVHNQTNANETWTITTTTSVSGTNSAQVLYDATLGIQDEELVSPAIDLTAASAPQLRFFVNLSYFWAIDPNDNYDAVVYADNGSGNTVIWEEADLGVFTSFDWIEVTVDLSSYVGDTINLTFAYEGADGASLNIDDIFVEEAPVCPDPNLTFTDFTDSTVDIAMDNSSNYEIEWGVFPYSQGGGGNTVTVTGVDTYQISGLAPGVSYNVFVRQDCGNGDFSNYVEVLTGTSISTISAFPFTEDFEIDPDQALLLNLGVSFAGGQSWSFSVDDPNDMNPDIAFDGVACFFSGNTFIDADTDAIMYIGPFDMGANNTYDISFQQRNAAASSSTRPNQDMNLIITQTPDGSNDVVLSSFVDMDNITYQQRTGSFTPTTSGEYYIGFHDVSSFLPTATQGNAIFIDALDVSETLSVDVFETSNFDYFVDSGNRLNLSANQTLEQITLHNLLGQQVLSQKLNAQEELIDLNELTNGVYLAQVQINGTSKTFKIIKK